MNGRKLFCEYARYKGNDAKTFDRIDPQFYADDYFYFLDSEGKTNRMTIDYREMVHWIIAKKKLTEPTQADKDEANIKWQ